jgi:hypothetical protein
MQPGILVFSVLACHGDQINQEKRVCPERKSVWVFGLDFEEQGSTHYV